MTIDIETLKAAAVGLVGAGSVALNGWLAFGRYWVRTRASNANDNQQIDMLERQSNYIERLEANNQTLRDENQKCWVTIAELKGRLQGIEMSLESMKQQNDELKRQVTELTKACMNLSRENALSRRGSSDEY